MNPKQAKRELERLNKIDHDRKCRHEADCETMRDLGLELHGHVGINIARWHLKNGGKINQARRRPIERLNETCGVQWVNDSPMFKRLRAVAFGTDNSTTGDMVKWELSHLEKWADFGRDPSLVWDGRLGIAEQVTGSDVVN